MLVIGATHDGFFPPVIIKQIAEKYHAEYRLFNCCHSFFLNTTWQEVADAIDEFITAL
jgi:hypothetical protein